MPSDKIQSPVLIRETNKEQTNNEEIIEQYLNSSNDYSEYSNKEENDEKFKAEMEHAYQCDFTKRSPPPCQHISLLSNLLSCTAPIKQSNTKRDYSPAIPIRSTLPPTMVSEDQLSESLKRNIAREHSHSSLKYKNIKKSNSSDSLTDNFSRY